MPDGKRKRPRKRQRKSKGEDVGQEIIAHVNDERNEMPSSVAEAEKARYSNGLDLVNGSKAEPSSDTFSTQVVSEAETAKSAPYLSFYQRTNPHKPSALYTLQGNLPRRYTVSVAIPGSIILNAQSPELQSRLAGQIARSCAIFNVDEIVVYDDGDKEERPIAMHVAARPMTGDRDGDNEPFDPNAFLARILQYVETPQYLRKSLFPMHRDLRMAGILAPLDCPHHLRFEERSTYREGICVNPPRWTNEQNSTWVHTGLKDPIQCVVKGEAGASAVPIGARVTVKMPVAGKKGNIVSPREPVQIEGIYWGYSTRLCNSLSEAISSSCWNKPYDLVIGTSERGIPLSRVVQSMQDAEKGEISILTPFRHALIVFGGLSGLEVAVESDPNINLLADEASELFDAWINVVEAQGSRTIRTEEALLITLSSLSSTLTSLGQQGESAL